MSSPLAPLGGGRGGRAGRYAAAVGVAMLAAAVAVLAALVSRLAWRPTSVVTVPWGLLLAASASAGLVVMAGQLARPLAFLAAGGWLVGVTVVLGGRPEGDYVLAQDWLGLSYLAVATAGVLGCAVRGSKRP